MNCNGFTSLFHFSRRSLFLGLTLVITIVLVGCNMPQNKPPIRSVDQPVVVSEQPLSETSGPASTPQSTTTVEPEALEGSQPQDASQVALPQVDNADPGSQVALPQVDNANPDSQVALPQVDNANPGSQVALPQVDNAGAGSQAAPATSAESSESIEGASSTAPVAEPQANETPLLAYLSEKNLFLVEAPMGSARQLTTTNDILSFAWAPDGIILATYNGSQLCFVDIGGTKVADCIEVETDDTQLSDERKIAWSPDKKHLVLWNTTTLRTEGSIGWIIVALDGSKEIVSIYDPVDWGLDIAPDSGPGGITGQALFLQDGRLIGTFTHNSLCSQAGCHYQVYQFDFVTKKLGAFDNKPQEGFSEGLQLVLSNDGKTLVNTGVFNSGCQDYLTFLDFYQLDSQTRTVFDLRQEAVNHITLAPDSTFAVIARSGICSNPELVNWASTCGLSPDIAIYPLQIWDFANQTRTDLFPAVTPAWSLDGDWLVFNTCLAQNASGGWEVSAETSPGIFLRSFIDGAVYKIGDGSQPAWQP